MLLNKKLFYRTFTPNYLDSLQNIKQICYQRNDTYYPITFCFGLCKIVMFIFLLNVPQIQYRLKLL